MSQEKTYQINIVLHNGNKYTENVVAEGTAGDLIRHLFRDGVASYLHFGGGNSSTCVSAREVESIKIKEMGDDSEKKVQRL